VPVDSSAAVEIENGGATLGVKFRRADVLLAVTSGDSVPVSVTGLVAGGCFGGTDVVRVKSPKVHHPQQDDRVAPGASVAVDWELSDASSPSAAILWSVNDGETWEIAARDIPNTGSYGWVVPNANTSAARIAVVQIESTDPADPTGYTVTGTLGVSDAFTIAGVLGISEPRAGFSLRALGNPSVGSLRVSYSLPDAKPASLDVYDVTGRQISSREVGTAGPGMHSVRLAEWVPPGVYVVRLSQAGHGLSARLSVVR